MPIVLIADNDANTPLIVLLDLNILHQGRRLIDDILADSILQRQHISVICTAAWHDAIPRAALDAGWLVIANGFAMTDLLTVVTPAAAKLPA